MIAAPGLGCNEPLTSGELEGGDPHNSVVQTSYLCLQGPVQSQNERSLVQESLRILRQGQEIYYSRLGPQLMALLTGTLEQPWPGWPHPLPTWD